MLHHIPACTKSIWSVIAISLIHVNWEEVLRSSCLPCDWHTSFVFILESFGFRWKQYCINQQQATSRKVKSLAEQSSVVVCSPESRHTVYYYECALGWICWILNVTNCFVRKTMEFRWICGCLLIQWQSYLSFVSFCWKPVGSVYHCYYIDLRMP